MNKKKKLSLSNYSLTYQLFFINMAVSFIGFVSLVIFNLYLIQNDRDILKDYDNSFKEVNKITNFLQNNSILRVPLFNENCESKIKQDNLDCKIINISDPELDPTSTQKFILQNFLKSNIDVKVYNDSWIKFADTDDMYISTEVAEIDIDEQSTEYQGFIASYRSLYINFFDNFRRNFIQNKYLKNSEKIRSEINIVSETIKKNKILSKKVHTNEDEIFQIITSPIINNKKIFGVVIISYPLISNNFNLALTSFNLFNFYALFVFIMLLLSSFFSRSLVSPIKKLSNLTLMEREKKRTDKIIDYPIRGDEIGTLSKEIKNMSSDLKSQIDQLEKFAADVSHELKNPLASLKTANDLLLNNKISLNDKKTLINNMDNDVQRMNRLITDISNYTKIKAEIETENFEYININELIKNITEQYYGNKKNIKILIENNQTTNIVLANKNKLSQVFYNLIDNSISIMAQNKNILISIINTEVQMIDIKIYDQGIGIPLDLSEKIFHRFYTDRDVEKNIHTGLGLSIAREIVLSFRGSIKLINSDKLEYSGACFIIKLPLKDIKEKNN